MKDTDYCNNPNLVSYLQMIQEPICRMSTISSVLKGFAATTLASVVGLSYQSIDVRILVSLFIPLFSFMSLDLYYLRLERRFRYLYDLVRKGEHEVDYSLKLSNDSLECQKARVVDCLRSPSIYLFYTPLGAFLIVLIMVN